jgi:transposase
MARFRGNRGQRKGAGETRSFAAVKLSRHDLSQLDEAYLMRLPEPELRVLSMKLLADLKVAHERLDQNPSNSSRPPSSRAPWERAEAGEATQAPAPSGSPADEPVGDDDADQEGDKPDDKTHADADPEPSAKPSEGQAASKQRRPGQQPGAPGHGRTQKLPITEQYHHYPKSCAACDDALADREAGPSHAAYLVIDLRMPTPERHAVEVVQYKHLYHECQCPCGHITRAEPGHRPKDETWGVALSERHLVGPTLVALICALSQRMRLSRRRIQEFLHDWLALELSIASINQCLHEAARALESVVEEQLLAEVRASELIHADETSWKENGQPLWLWVFVCATTTVFTIGRRSQEVLYETLGRVLDAWLMSDGYCVYRDYEQRLRCLAHLVRKARGLEESLERDGQQLGAALRSCLETVMNAVYAAREGPPPPTSLRKQHAQQINALLALAFQYKDSAHEKTRALARELLNDWDTFWVVLDHPELPLTNNLAERALRHWVIARRISYGTRNAQGSRAVCLLASVIETCRQRGHSPWTFIAETLRERRKGNPAPILPAAAA